MALFMVVAPLLQAFQTKSYSHASRFVRDPGDIVMLFCGFCGTGHRYVTLFVDGRDGQIDVDGVSLFK